MKRRMTFDVESVGLYGEHFAFGYLIADGDRVIEEGLAVCNPETAMGDGVDLAWVKQHIFPWIHDMSPEFPTQSATIMNDPTTGVVTHLCADTIDLREVFWSIWARERVRGSELWVDVAVPVEAGFLAACVRDDRTSRKFEGPYPLLDIATAKALAGVKGLPRRRDELPEHHPLMDTRHSFRGLLVSLEALHIPF